MRALLFARLLVPLLAATPLVRAADAKPNVLFIAIDDLRDWVGYTGRNPQAKTPNIDRLSQMGVSFTRAYCAAPVCNPSRAALLSGLRPATTGCYQNENPWKPLIPEGRGLSFVFKSAGYEVLGAGKIYHNDTFYPGEWSGYFKPTAAQRNHPGVQKNEGFREPLKHDLADADIDDWHITNYCIEQLGKKHDAPLFLACGLHKPHLPWAVPRKYYEMFPLESIALPPFKADDLDDLPAAGVKKARAFGDHAAITGADRWKAAIQSYLASIAYTDMNIGRLLDALEKSPQRENTIVCFWGDHGWHLGEKSHWRKFALWEEATRAPLIFAGPGIKAGAKCGRSVDFLSIYPTLCELAGLATPAHVEGKSIRALLTDPAAPWTEPALTTDGFGNHAVRSEGWRYIRYHDGGEELYDETKDPNEWTNLAGNSDFAAQKAELARSIPQTEKPAGQPRAAPGKPRF